MDEVSRRIGCFVSFRLQKPAREQGLNAGVGRSALAYEAVSKLRICPTGTAENSPPIHRWGKVQCGASPVGTTENGDVYWISAVPAGLPGNLRSVPTDKSVGYFHKIPTGFYTFDTTSHAQASA